MTTMNIAIDGPSGAGKSTIAKEVAKKLSYIYIDTGALYRAVGLYVCTKGIALDDTAGMVKCIKEINVDLKHIAGVQRVLLCGEDVTELIRTPQISMYASAVSAVKEVRTLLFDLQRDLAKKHNVIMDGRDIGTVVLPHAQIKIFLFADVNDRAMRRFLELKDKENGITFAQVLRDMKSRDENDANREIAPLKPANDAVLLDTTGYTLDHSVAKMMEIIRGRLN